MFPGFNHKSQLATTLACVKSTLNKDEETCLGLTSWPH